MSFIDGAYTITYKASSVGQLQDGARLSHQHFKRLITGDNFAESPQDAIFRGGAQFSDWTMLEYNAAAALSAFYPFGSAWLTMDAVIGVLDSSKYGSLVLTAVAGTPAAASPATVTLPRSIIMEGFDVALLMAPDLRTVPMRMRHYVGSGGVFGTLT